MSDQPIQNCGWRFAFQCPKQWDALRETAEAGVRACDHCQKRVYLCRSESELSRHVREGHCVAVPARIRTPVPPQAFTEPGDLEPVDVLAARHGLKVVHLEGRKLDPSALRLVPLEIGLGYHLCPLGQRGSTLFVAMSDPSRAEAIDKVRFLTGLDVKVAVAPWREISSALAQWSQCLQEELVEVGLMDMEPDSGRSKQIKILLRYVLLNAHREAAEQIRIEATDSTLVIRHLVADTLHEIMRPPLTLQAELLRQIQERSGARVGQPGLFEYHSQDFRAHCQVHLHPLERGVEVVLVVTGREVR